MKKFIINAEIVIDEDLVEFKSPFQLEFGSGKITKAELRSSPKKIIVNYEVVCDSGDEAEEVCVLHLGSVANKLAFKENLPINDFKILSIACEDNDEHHTNITCQTAIACQFNLIKEKMILGQNSIEKLKKFLETNFTANNIDEYFFMYREAIIEKSRVFKFYLFYRLLEKIIEDNDGKGQVIKWIENQDPSVIKKLDPYRKKNVPIYTFLRDNVHPKDSVFPYNEIIANLNGLVKLVKKAFKDKLNV